jgi:hypothetical protein
MYVFVGTWWIAGTVYLDLSPVEDTPGTRPLGNVMSEIGLLPHDERGSIWIDVGNGI